MYIIDLDELDFGIEKYEKDSEGNYIINEHGSKITTEAYKISYQEFKDVKGTNKIIGLCKIGSYQCDSRT